MAIAAGNMGILRTSHAVYEEASTLMHEAAIFRIPTYSYGPLYSIRAPLIDFRTSQVVQKVEVRVTIEPVPNARGVQAFMSIVPFTANAGAVVQRDTCHITFRKTTRTVLSVKPESLLCVVKKLRGFKRIIVTATAESRAEDTVTQRAFIQAMNESVYRMALEELEPVFGPGIWHDGPLQESRYIEFRPMHA